jgi:hypothetical protein
MSRTELREEGYFGAIIRLADGRFEIGVYTSTRISELMSCDLVFDYYRIGFHLADDRLPWDFLRFSDTIDDAICVFKDVCIAASPTPTNQEEGV